MKKNWLAAILISFLTISVSGQTLFTYGKYKADATEFLRAFNKNNQQPAVGKAAAIREYLELYINSRLKIRQAYDRGYDTLPQITSEVENLRNQIIENYMNDPQAVEQLTKEAFQRSLKDIHVAHIFIADLTGDTLASGQKLKEVLNHLGKKEDFQSVAQQFSDDPSARINKGDLSYVTVFTLPYEFENILYATPPGKYSVYRSKTGYHIFKNLGERKALGKIKIQQILIAFPPGINETGKKRTAQLADSLYQRILAGDDFGKLAATFSNDMMSAAAEGNLPDVGVGEYEPAFEKSIWGLATDGAVSKPFLTSHGYHIVKRIKLVPAVTNPNDKPNLEDLKQKVTTDDRWKTSRDFIYTGIRSKAGFRVFPYNDAVLWAISDSLLDSRPAGIGAKMSVTSPLFQIGGRTYTVSEWINYATMNRYRPDRGLKPYNTVMQDYHNAAMEQYYREHLEDFNEDFRNQMNEFRDGNLFFEIMQQEVWNKAQADSSILAGLYEKNRSKYYWNQSAEAVIFFCADQASAKTLGDQLKNNPSNWKKFVDSLNEKVASDSGRYEWQQIPGLDKAAPRAGTITSPIVNPTDNTVSFAYIIKVYTQPSARSFTEAKGLVMNDYQTILEEQWLKELKTKYPVVVDEKVLAAISK